MRLPAELVARTLYLLACDEQIDHDGKLSSAMQTLLAARSVSRLVRDLADADSLWQILCDLRWKVPLVGFNFGVSRPCQVYAARHYSDQAALAGLDGIIAEHLGRLRRVVALSEANQDGNMMGEVLADRAKQSSEQMYAWSGHFAADSKCEMPPRLLAAFYWSHELHGALTRSFVAHRWAARRPLDFEEGIALFSAFREADMRRVTQQIDQLTSAARHDMISRGIDGADARLVASTLLNVLKAKGFGPADPEHYYDRTGSFVDCVLDFHRRTLPMSLVWVYCTVARRLGVDASPVNWPGTMIVIVQGAQSDWASGMGAYMPCDPPIYVNLFDTAEHFTSRQELASRLSNPPVVLPEPLHALHLEPASTVDLVARTARNILSSNATMQPALAWTRRDTVLANYAAIVALIATHSAGAGGRAVLAQPHFIASVLEECPLDLGLLKRVSGLHLGATVQMRDLASVFAHAEAEDTALPKRSTFEGHSHPVGRVFRHRKYQYIAVVLGYDLSCQMSPEWIAVNGVENLSRGSRQPFMHALRSDNLASHYVAEACLLYGPATLSFTE